jgi:hypothetical protein
MEWSRSFLRGDGEPDDFDRARHAELVIFTKQFDRFPGWRFTQIEVVHTLLSGYHYELNT